VEALLLVGKISLEKLELDNTSSNNRMFSSARLKSLTRVGVIDIGSNSVRMVVFDGAARSPAYFFNENIFCGLGEGLGKGGVLNLKAKERAFRALSRFSTLIKSMKISPITCVATAAVRQATDGQKFCEDVFLKTGLTIKVLTGIEEANLSAQGVFLGWPEADGVMCDIGGSSLEVAEIGNGVVGKCVSIPLGPLNLMPLMLDKKALKKKIDQDVKYIGNHSQFSGKDLFLVGGSWRAIARLDMERRRYPLKVLHEYRMTQESVSETVKWILSKDIKKLGTVSGLSKSRLRLVPIAARVLRALSRELKPRSIFLSSYGIREGLLYEQMPYKLKRLDPLLEACRLDEEQNARFPGFGSELYKFIKPIFKDVSNERVRLIKSACLLHDVNWRAHPDYRAEVCFDNATRANLGGLTHMERIFLGVSLLHRYKNRRKYTNYQKALSLLSDIELREAEVLGKAMRFGATFSRSGERIPAKLEWDSKQKLIKLTLKAKSKSLYGEIVAIRFSSLAKALGAVPEVI
jgi:exopolyphosphatase/guanosine-5'-triphosphate,3'-diphosphate pyrophosphatase